MSVNGAAVTWLQIIVAPWIVDSVCLDLQIFQDKSEFLRTVS